MRVAGKIATGSGLLVALLAGVLAYQVELSRRSVSVSRDLFDKMFRASELLRGQAGLLADIDEQRRKLEVTRDPLYAGKTTELRAAYEDRARKLGEIDLWHDEPEQIGRLAQLWADAWRVPEQPAAAAPPAAGGDAEEPAEVRAAVPEAKTLQALREETNRLLEELHRRMNSRVASVSDWRREAERVSWGVLGVALGLCTLIVLLTVRSIQEPLDRLIAGTRAVAAGQFDYQLDASRNDEFAALAAAFNDMVRRLSELDRMKKDFVAHVSHEIRNPLVAMQETNQLLAEQLAGPLTERQQRLLQLNVESGRRLSAMLSNLLDLSSLEAGAMAYQFRAEDLSDLVRLALGEFEARAREKSVELTCAPPKAGPAIVVPCDRDRLLQVLENLLDNAVKFSPPGARVEVGVARQPAPPREGLPARWRTRLARVLERRGVALVTVTDSGPGVPDVHKQAIFEKFHQVGKAQRPSGSGVGLGLAICRQIVEAHDGAIWVTDRPGGGSVFHLLLPAARAAVSSPAPGPRRLTAAEGTRS